MTALPFLAESANQAGGVSFPPLETWHYPSQIFWLAILFGFLYIVLSRFVLPRLGGVLEHRESTIATDLDEAARINEQAVEAQNAVEISIAQAQSKARETAGKTRLKIDTNIANETAKIDAELDTKLGNAEERISNLRDAAMQSVEQIATDAAKNMLAKFETSTTSVDLGRAVKSALAEEV